MSFWNYFLNTMTACSYAEENETPIARALMEDADRKRLAEAARLSPANLSFAAAALAEEGLWQDAVAMDDEADRLLVREAATSPLQRIFAAAAFGEAGEAELAREMLADGVQPLAADIQVQDRRIELFLQGYVRIAGAVAFAEAGDREQALRLGSSGPARILVIADGSFLPERMRDYAIRLAEKAGLELVAVTARREQPGRKKAPGSDSGLQLLLEEARRHGIPCRHFAAGGENRPVDAICAELGGVAFVLTESARQETSAACGDVPVFTMAFLDEALGLPTAA